MTGRPKQARKPGGPDRWPLDGSKMAQRAPQNMLRGPMRLSSCPRMARERPLINFAFSCYPQPPRRGALSLEVAGFEGQREGRRRDSFSRFSALDGSRLASGKPQDNVCGELYGFEFQSMALGWCSSVHSKRLQTDRPDSRQTLCFEFADVSESVYRPVDRQTLCFELADVSNSVRGLRQFHALLPRLARRSRFCLQSS